MTDDQFINLSRQILASPHHAKYRYFLKQGEKYHERSLAPQREAVHLDTKLSRNRRIEERTTDYAAKRVRKSVCDYLEFRRNEHTAIYKKWWALGQLSFAHALRKVRKIVMVYNLTGHNGLDTVYLTQEEAPYFVSYFLNLDTGEVSKLVTDDEYETTYDFDAKHLTTLSVKDAVL